MPDTAQNCDNFNQSLFIYFYLEGSYTSKHVHNTLLLKGKKDFREPVVTV